MKNYYYFEDDDEDERRKRRRKTKTKTKDENGVDRKRTEERRKLIQNKCALVSSKKIRMRKEEGATVAAHLPSLTAGRLFRWFVGPVGSKQRLIQTIGKASLNTRKDLTTKRRQSFQISSSFGSPKTDETTNETNKNAE
jgi:hypothetical protein